MYKHKKITFKPTNGDLAGKYYLLEFGPIVLGLASIRNDNEFMFRFNSEAAKAYIDSYILTTITEILGILNRKHGLNVNEAEDTSNNYEY